MGNGHEIWNIPSFYRPGSLKIVANKLAWFSGSARYWMGQG